MSWMQGTGFSISEKLEITHLTAGDGSLVRGVVVLENIRRGETLCNLPVHLICKHCAMYCLLKYALHTFMEVIDEICDEETSDTFDKVRDCNFSAEYGFIRQ